MLKTLFTTGILSAMLFTFMTMPTFVAAQTTVCDTVGALEFIQDEARTASREDVVRRDAARDIRKHARKAAGALNSHRRAFDRERLERARDELREFWQHRATLLAAIERLPESTPAEELVRARLVNLVRIGEQSSCIADVPEDLPGPALSEAVSQVEQAGVLQTAEFGLEIVAKTKDGTWQHSHLDVDGSFSSTSIQLDRRGYQHVIGRNTSSGNLIYATNVSGAWVTEELPIQGFRNALQVDDDGYVHLLFTNSSPDFRVRYATNQSGAWIERELSSSGTIGTEGLAVDNREQPHLVFADHGTQTIRYATRDRDGIWQVTDIDSYQGDAPFTDITLDRGEPHIVYARAGSGELIHAWLDRDQWQLDTVAENGTFFAGNFVKVALDRRDNPHIVTYDGASESNGLKHLGKNRDGWIEQVIHPGISSPYRPSIGLNEEHELQVFHFGDDTNDGGFGLDTLRYGNWQLEHIPATVRDVFARGFFWGEMDWRK